MTAPPPRDAAPGTAPAHQAAVAPRASTSPARSRSPDARPSALLRPQVALPIVAAVIVLVALFTPEQQGGGRAGDSRLTTFSSSSQGARGLFELAQRLGWRAERRLTDSIPLGDTNVVHLVLDPPLPLAAADVHALLESVRRGAGLVYVVGGGALSDSLGVRIGGAGILVRPDTATCGPGTGGILAAGLPFWPDRRVHLLALRWREPAPERRTTLTTVRIDASGRADRELPTVVGFPLEQGRVVVVADPDLLRNDVMRVCRWGTDVAAVRALEYASARDDVPPRDRLLFDEYHQGYGDRPGTLRGIARFLGGTSAGYLVLQLAAAGLVLILALAPRALPPRAVERIERRSPLEHVDALARAYQQVGATRTATARLIHGVRRRVEHGMGPGTSGAPGAPKSDEGFLDWALSRAPERAGDIATIREALSARTPRRGLAEVGDAIRRLEASLVDRPSRA